VLSLREKAPKDAAERAEIEKELKHMNEVGDRTLCEEDFATAFCDAESAGIGCPRRLSLRSQRARAPNTFTKWVNWYLAGQSEFADTHAVAGKFFQWSGQ